MYLYSLIDSSKTGNRYDLGNIFFAILIGTPGVKVANLDTTPKPTTNPILHFHNLANESNLFYKWTSLTLTLWNPPTVKHWPFSKFSFKSDRILGRIFRRHFRQWCSFFILSNSSKYPYLGLFNPWSKSYNTRSSDLRLAKYTYEKTRLNKRKVVFHQGFFVYRNNTFIITSSKRGI